jgi:phage baseplate assembly protein W
MADIKYINITYPFKNSPKGFFLDLTTDDNAAIKSDFLHLLLTKRGQRLYKPDFGTNILQYIFEPNDSITQSDLLNEISTSVSKYLPNLSVDTLTIEQLQENEHVAKITISYTITNDVFETSETLVISV